MDPCGHHAKRLPPLQTANDLSAKGIYVLCRVLYSLMYAIFLRDARNYPPGPIGRRRQLAGAQRRTARLQREYEADPTAIEAMTRLGKIEPALSELKSLAHFTKDVIGRQRHDLRNGDVYLGASTLRISRHGTSSASAVSGKATSAVGWPKSMSCGRRQSARLQRRRKTTSCFGGRSTRP